MSRANSQTQALPAPGPRSAWRDLRRGGLWLAVWLLACVALAATASARGLPYRQTRVSLRSTVSAPSLLPGAELTYNPTVSMSARMYMSWWFNDKFYFNGRLNLTRELTNSDSTTALGEWQASDTTLLLGTDSFYTIPWVDVDLGGEIEAVLPSSKASQAQTLLLETAANLYVIRPFMVYGGPLLLFYTFRPAKSFHRYTTGELQGPSVLDCTSSPGGCARFYNSGERNVSWSLTNDFTAFYKPNKWLAVFGSVGTVTSFLYDRAKFSGVSLQQQNAAYTRHLNYYVLAARLYPTPPLEITFGTSTVNPQLAPGGGYYSPIFNRYTTMYVDLRLDFAKLMTTLRGGDKTKAKGAESITDL